MAGNKKPRKKYRPGRAAANKSLLMQLPIADETALRMQRDMERRVLSMRLSQKNPADMVSIVVCLGTVWLLAEKTNQTEQVRAAVEKGIAELRADLPAGGCLAPAAYDALIEAAAYCGAVLRCTTGAEYLEQSRKVEEAGELGLVNDFLDELRSYTELITEGEEPSPADRPPEGGNPSGR